MLTLRSDVFSESPSATGRRKVYTGACKESSVGGDLPSCWDWETWTRLSSERRGMMGNVVKNKKEKAFIKEQGHGESPESEIKNTGIKTGRGDLPPEISVRPVMSEFREMEAEEIQACGDHSRWTPWYSQGRGKDQQQSGGTETSQPWAACSRSSHRDTSFPWAVTLVWQAPWGHLSLLEKGRWCWPWVAHSEKLLVDRQDRCRD